MSFSTRPRIGELLVQAGVIDDFQLRSALGEQQRWGGRLGVTLVKLGFIEERELVRALAGQLGLPVAHLEGKRLTREVLSLVPMDVAEQHMCLPLFVRDELGTRTLYLGMEDPCDLALQDDVGFRTGLMVKPVLMGPSEIAEGIDRFYRRPYADTQVELQNAEPAAIPLPELLEEDETEREITLGAPFEEPARQPEESMPAPVAVEAPDSLAPSDAPVDDIEAAPRSELRSEPEEKVESPAPAPVEAASDPGARGVLQALTQILIEKGLIDRSELYERVQEIRAGTRSGD